MIAKSVAATASGNRREPRAATGFLREFARNRAIAAAFGYVSLLGTEAGIGSGIGIGIGWLRDRQHATYLERAATGIKTPIGWLQGI